MNQERIKQAILQTIVFYDQFQFPLTNMEIYEHLWDCQCLAHECWQAVDELRKEKKIDFGEGFYFLQGRNELIKIRQKRYLSSYKKWRLVKKNRWIFSLVPYLKLVGVSNTLGYSNAKKDGDIDLLVVTQKDRLFITRTWLTVVTFLAGKWRHGKNIADRFCLSFYLAEDNLDLSQLKLDDNDIYLIYWIKWFKPIWCTDKNTADEFWQKNNWVNDKLANSIFVNLVDEINKPNIVVKWWEKILNSWLGDWLEAWLKNMQLSKIKANSTVFSVDGIMASDKILKFHPGGKRREYREKWERKVKS